MNGEGLVEKAASKIFDKLGWIKRRLAGNTFDKVVEKCIESFAKDQSESIIEFFSDRKIEKIHKENKYTIAFPKLEKKNKTAKR